MQPVKLSIKENDKILVIAPHPDDECIGVGGVLSLYPELCTVILLTNGSRGIPGESQFSAAKIREEEFVQEMKYLGISDYIMLNIPDGTLMNHLDCLRDIKFEEYTKIFIPWVDDNHPDHTAGFDATIRAIREQKINNVEIYQYEVHTAFHDVDRFIDISKVIKKKTKLIQFHKSQLLNKDYVEIAVALAKYRACLLDDSNSFFEGFVITDINNDSDVEFSEREKTIQRIKQQKELLTKWVDKLIGGKDIKGKLKQLGYETTSIYGYADLGMILRRQMDEEEISLVDIFDKRKAVSELCEDMCIMPENGDRTVDVVIVTAIYYYDEIEKELYDLGYKKVLSLEELIENL